MIVPHVTDDIDIAPTETGPHGRAWRVDLATATMPRLPGEEHATLALWIVEAAWAHPLWHSYMISLVHLRPMADERPTVIHLEGATHEMLVYALNPDVSRRPAITGAAYPSLLHPANFAAQMSEISDEVATERIRRTVREICAGGLNPDTDWCIVRWCTELRVKRLLLENVPEFEDWGPVDTRTGRPIKSRKGEYFRAWWAALEAIGFRLERRVVNCASYGDPTTRERLFIKGRSDGRPIRWSTPSHARNPDMFGAQRWRSTRDHVIDWSIPGRSIFDRKRPLAPKTLARIAAGIVKFGWPEPFLVVLRQHCDALGIDVPLPTVTAGGTHMGLVQPFVTRTAMHKSNALGVRGDDQPLATITTDGGFGVVAPFVLSQASGGAPREVAEPLMTVPGGGAHALIAPYYSTGVCQTVTDPMPTATTKARFGLVMPVTHNCDGNRARHIDDPVPTITTAKRGELAFIAASFGERPTQAPRVHGIDEPTPTVCATGRTNLITPGREHDILFRMLEPHELAAAMSISTAERPYLFAGNKTEIVRQIGQAVPRRTARALAIALAADAAATEQAA